MGSSAARTEVTKDVEEQDPSWSNNHLSRTRTKGSWNVEEDADLISLVHRYGQGNWSLIAQHFPGRIGKQCRERWHNQLRPDIKRDAWQPNEEQLLIDAHRRLGNKWADIAKLIPGRTENGVKNHWNATLRKKDCGGVRRDQDRQPSVLKHYMNSISATGGGKVRRGGGGGRRRWKPKKDSTTVSNNGLVTTLMNPVKLPTLADGAPFVLLGSGDGSRFSSKEDTQQCPTRHGECLRVERPQPCQQPHHLLQENNENNSSRQYHVHQKRDRPSTPVMDKMLDWITHASNVDGGALIPMGMTSNAANAIDIADTDAINPDENRAEQQHTEISPSIQCTNSIGLGLSRDFFKTPELPLLGSPIFMASTSGMAYAVIGQHPDSCGGGHDSFGGVGISSVGDGFACASGCPHYLVGESSKASLHEQQPVLGREELARRRSPPQKLPHQKKQWGDLMMKGSKRLDVAAYAESHCAWDVGYHLQNLDGKSARRSSSHGSDRNK